MKTKKKTRNPDKIKRKKLNLENNLTEFGKNYTDFIGPYINN